MKIKIFSKSVVVFCLFISNFACAVDKEDLYAFLYGGTRLDRKVQGGFGVGYAPFNSVGFGMLFDQTRFSSQAAFEGRWFVEPVEVATAIGIYKNHAAGFNKSSRVAILIEADYLFAITPSIAAKAIARPQFVLKGTSSFLVGLGGRIIF